MLLFWGELFTDPNLILLAYPENLSKAATLALILLCYHYINSEAVDNVPIQSQSS